MSTTDLGIVMVAVVVGSLLKSITGLGLPLIAIPVIALFLGIKEAVILVAIPNLALNVALAWRERSHLGNTRDLLMLGLTGIVGALAGTLLLVSIPSEPLVIVLTVVVIAYVAVALTTPDFALAPETSRRWSPIVGTSVGFMQGAIGISGPLLASWIHSYRLQRQAYVLSVSILFMVAGLAQCGVLTLGGKFEGLWTTALLACIPAILTVPVGTRLRTSLSSRAFDLAILGTLVASVIALVLRTFA